jgi:hypothetical protein
MCVCVCVCVCMYTHTHAHSVSNVTALIKACHRTSLAYCLTKESYYEERLLTHFESFSWYHEPTRWSPVILTLF